MKPQRFTVSKPGMDIIVPDEDAAVSMALAGYPNVKITDGSGKDVTRNLLDLLLFKSKFTFLTPDGNLLVVPLNFQIMLPKPSGGDC